MNRPKILYVVHRVPYPPDKGDRIRTFHVLRFLAERFDVHLACLADESVSDTTIASLQSYCERVSVVRLESFGRWVRTALSLLGGHTASEGAFRSPELHRIVHEWSTQTRFHAAVASASSMAPYLRQPNLRDVPAVVDLTDVDSQKWIDYAAVSWLPRSLLYRTEAKRLRRLETSIADWAHAITFVSQAEVDLYRTFCRTGSVYAVPNGVDLDYYAPRMDDSTVRPDGVSLGQYPRTRCCVFVGAMDYLPNVDGVCWFCEHVWPNLLQHCPEAKFYVVGRNPAAAVRRCGSIPGVEIIGSVPDVRPYLRHAPVAVVPLRIARGLQNKVLEAMAMSRAVVASPPALAGVQAEPGLHVLRASTPQQWVDTIWWLWTDGSLCRAFGESGRCYVEEHHRWDECLRPFAAVLNVENEPQLEAV